MSKPIVNPRLLAVNILLKIDNGKYSNLELNQQFQNNNLKKVDQNLCTKLVYGVLQNKKSLDFWLRYFIDFKKVDLWILELLRLSLYQLNFLDRIPKHAVFNESIKLAKLIGNQGIGNFVTAVLHNIDRKGLPDINEITDEITRLSIQYSVPKFLIKKLINQTNKDLTIAILKSINQDPARSIRLNNKCFSQAELTELLEESHLKIIPSKVASLGARVVEGNPINSLAFQRGSYTFQDESAMLPVEALDVQENSEVLDACAAPGGKTTQIAQLLNGGHVTALDVYQHKIDLIQKNAQRLKLADWINAQLLDAKQANKHFAVESFDRILVDAPCSGWGLLRRKPEIRYNRSDQDGLKLQQQQLAILNSVADLLKVNGKLVYCTCTILKEENEDIVQEFLHKHPNFEIKRVKTNLRLKDSRKEPWLTIYPNEYLTDGFFISLLQRTK